MTHAAHKFRSLADNLLVVRRFVRRLLFRTIPDLALMLDRERAGREASPSGGLLDSQTAKTPFAETRRFDGGKKVGGASGISPWTPTGGS